MLELSEENFQKTIQKEVWMILLYRSTCYYCSQIRDIIENKLHKYKIYANFGEIDVDNNLTFYDNQSSKSIPQIQIYRNGIKEFTYSDLKYLDDNTVIKKLKQLMQKNSILTI